MLLRSTLYFLHGFILGLSFLIKNFKFGSKSIIYLFFSNFLFIDFFWLCLLSSAILYHLICFISGDLFGSSHQLKSHHIIRDNVFGEKSI